MVVIEPLNPEVHNRLAFSCGNEKLDRFLHELAHQAKRKGLAATFVAVDDAEPTKILGYYSLSSYMVDAGTDLPFELRRQRKLPTHLVGATLLGRLAVATPFQGRGLGTHLLVNALKRAYTVCGDVASVCVVVDAIDAEGVGFYEPFGFVRIAPESLRLVLMMDTIAELLPNVSTTTAEAS